ncbi:MAG: hypothetical protein AAFV80_20795, partial [Bacteroidota bacterium]
MKQLFFLFAFILLLNPRVQAQVGINTDNSNPAPSAMLDVQSPDKGILVPRMDSTSRKNIVNPAEGLMVYDTTSNSFWFFDETWMDISRSGSTGDNLGDHKATKNIELQGNWLTRDGGNEGLFIDTSGRIGIGTNTPDNQLDVEGSIRLNDQEFYFRPGTDTRNGLGYYDQSKLFANTPVNGPVIYGNGGGGLGYKNALDSALVLSWNGNGNVGIGNTFPLNILDVEGGIAVGSTYAGTNIAPTNGAIIEGKVGIGQNLPNSSAILDVQSPDKGILVPRMDSTSRKNITTPADGLMVYDSTFGTFWYYENLKWNEIRNGSDRISSSDIFGSTSPLDLVCSEIVTVDSTYTAFFTSWMTVSGNYAYVTDFYYGTLEIYDISNPKDIVFKSSINPSLGSGFVAVEGNYAYVSEVFFGTSFSIVDISNPSNPVYKANFTTGAYVIDIAVSGNYAYVLTSNSSELKIIDVSNPSAPVSAGSLDLGVSLSTVKRSGNYLYVTNATPGDLRIL